MILLWFFRASLRVLIKNHCRVAPGVQVVTAGIAWICAGFSEGLISGRAGLVCGRNPNITITMSDSSLKITAYLKTFCGWSEGVRAIMRKYDLPFEEKDIIRNPAFRWEMEQRSGQSLSPCVEINGTMLADVSGEEVEQWMIANGLVSASDDAPDAPINSACSDEQHRKMAAAEHAAVPGKIRFLD